MLAPSTELCTTAPHVQFVDRRVVGGIPGVDCRWPEAEETPALADAYERRGGVRMADEEPEPTPDFDAWSEHDMTAALVQAKQIIERRFPSLNFSIHPTGGAVFGGPGLAANLRAPSPFAYVFEVYNTDKGFRLEASSPSELTSLACGQYAERLSALAASAWGREPVATSAA